MTVTGEGKTATQVAREDSERSLVGGFEREFVRDPTVHSVVNLALRNGLTREQMLERLARELLADRDRLRDELVRLTEANTYVKFPR